MRNHDSDVQGGRVLSCVGASLFNLANYLGTDDQRSKLQNGTVNPTKTDDGSYVDLADFIGKQITASCVLPGSS